MLAPAAVADGSLDAELGLDSTPESPVLSTTVTPAATALVELTGQVLGAVGDRVSAKRLAEHVGVIVGVRRVVQGLEESSS